MVSALNVESLVGGYTASEGTFQHQAAIFARENFSVDIELICNGAIIGPTIVLTAAQCFLGQLRTLKELSFFIIVNSTDLTTSAGVVVDITYIYVPESMESTPFSFLFNDIAIVQTALNMLVLHGCHLKSLKIPMYGESFSWASAEVAGYGDNEITLEAQANSNVRIMVNGKTNYTLNYANVIILGDSECYNSFVRIKLPVDKLMCGVMKTDRPGQHWGLCSNDFGAPLVYNNTVIGIASEHTPDCNDTVSALNVESLIGGYRAPEGTFKYQAAIIAKLNYTRDVFLVCSGGIISPSLILTAAQCFFNDFRRLKDFSFSIIVNSTDLTKRTQLTVNITNIYIPDYHLVRYFTFSTNDIAIAQVEENLFLVFPDSHLQSLNIPTIYGLSYARKTAVVGAYGDHWIILQPNPINAQFTRIEGRSDYKLNYANVTILTDTQCYRNFLPRVKLPIDNLMCGVMLTEHLGQHWGICENDFGAPLVYNNTVIGIATDHTPECNDTVKGGLYIKVSTFTFFLNQVLRHVHFGSNMEDVLVYCNRPHISESQFLVDL